MKAESHPYEYKLIKAGFITVNHTYQREKRQPVVKQILQEFDYRLVNPVKVVCRDGQYYAWDGQQTTTALREMFGDNYLVPCMIYRDVPSANEEAKLFENINDRKARTPVSDKDLWKSKISRGDASIERILEICDRHGYDIFYTNKKHGKTVRALRAVGNIYEFLGDEKFDEEFSVLRETWYGNENALKANMLYGLALFIDCYHGKYDRSRLVAKLKDKTPEGILAAATASAAVGNIKYAREILNVYNNHARCPLKDELVSKRI